MVAGYHDVEGGVVGLVLREEVGEGAVRFDGNARVEVTDAREGGLGALSRHALVRWTWEMRGGGVLVANELILTDFPTSPSRRKY